MMLFLFLETGMLGVFLALDLLLFFVFWEIGLVPMYFLINQWGSANRDYASLKFMIYTMGGSLGLLLGIQLLGALFGTFDLATHHGQVDVGRRACCSAFQLQHREGRCLLGFCDCLCRQSARSGHSTPGCRMRTRKRPTAGSMILAGVLLKLGAYGFLRLVLPLYPAEAQAICVRAGAAWRPRRSSLEPLARMGRSDFKRLVAYSSVNHMGFVVLGIAAAALAAGTADARIALNGAILQMFNHGLSAAGMFFLVGVIYDRTHTRNLDDFGGLFPLVPIYGGILIFTSMASLGLPGLNGFVSEFLVVRGTFPILTAYTAVSMLGLLFTGAYILKGIKKVLHGPLNEHWARGEHKLDEINTREIVVIAPLDGPDARDRRLAGVDPGDHQQSRAAPVLRGDDDVSVLECDCLHARGGGSDHAGPACPQEEPYALGGAGGGGSGPVALSGRLRAVPVRAHDRLSVRRAVQLAACRWASACTLASMASALRLCC